MSSSSWKHRERGCACPVSRLHTRVRFWFHMTGLLCFPSTWGLRSRQIMKDGTAISKGNIICLSTSLILKNLIHAKYRSRCFLLQPVTTKKSRFQLPSLLIFHCFTLRNTFLWDPKTQAKFHSFLLPFVHLTHCLLSQTRLVLTRRSGEGLSFWAIAVPQSEQLTYITKHHAHTFRGKDCDPSRAALRRC